MDPNNIYYDVNQNPNIFPASRSYIPPTQLRTHPTQMYQQNAQFNQLAEQQRRQNNLRLLRRAPGTINLSNSNFAAVSYANDPQHPVYQDPAYNVHSTQLEPSSQAHVQEWVENKSPRTPHTPRTQGPQQLFGNNTMNEGGFVLPDDEDEDKLNNPNIVLEKNELNQTAHAPNAYPNVFSQGPFFQLPQKNLIADPDPNYLSIDSHDRNRTKYPNPNCYTIPLITSDDSGIGSVPGRRYKNITSIELISGIIPNRNNVLDEIYLILRIDEISEPVYDASNHNLSSSFAKLSFETCDGTSKWLRLNTDVTDPLLKIFYPSPKASFDRMTIKLLKRDGTPFDFGTDNAHPTSPNPDLQNSWTFKITTKVVDVDVLGHRNI